MTEQDTYYKPGLIFLSNYAGYVLHIRDATFYPPMPDGTREPHRPSLVADFSAGLGGSQVNLVADDGQRVNLDVFGVEGFQGSSEMSDMRGGALDLDQQASANEWTDEEREFVARRLCRLAAKPGFNDFWLYEAVQPGPPWPTYDDTHHFKIAALAVELGLVNEALFYESRTKNRQSVLDALQGKVQDEKVEAELTV